MRRAYNKLHPEEKLAAKIFDLHEGKKIGSGVKELSIVCELSKHCNLVEYKRIKITSKNRLYIIMELCSQSLSQKIIAQESYFAEAEVWRLLSNFVEGYKVLYSKSIIHRDIKPDNILIGLDGNYKITDFGLSDIINGLPIKKGKGSLCYMAP